MNANGMTRRDLLKRMGLAAGLAAVGLELPFAAKAQEKSGATPEAAPSATPKRLWYEPGFMPDPVLDNQLLFYLGSVYEGMADVGEVLDTAFRMDTADPMNWPREWVKTADRLGQVAQKSLAAGHTLSAGEACMRSANYYRAALIHYPNTTDPDIARLAQKSVDAYEQAMKLLGIPAQKVEIPYEGSSLLAWFYRSPAAADKAPVLIVHQGRDAWPEETKHVLDGALKRGYHVLQVHGPGQGVSIRLKGLPFRPDWEKVITPVVDFAVAQPGVDPERIVLIGFSMGGALAPRAAAFEKRIKICIANPGVLNWGESIYSYLEAYAPGISQLLASDPKAFDVAVGQFLAGNALYQWWFADSAWKHGAKSPSDMLLKLKEFDNTSIVDRITCKVLVMDGEAEAFSAGQAKKLYDALKCPKEYMLFTAEDTGLVHCQTGALAVSGQRMFDWLDENI
jgi:pimeloyl-ACP methyl ester carboxylesterase